MAIKHPIEPGMRFGKLVAIRPNGKGYNGETEWLFRCDCGNEKIVIRSKVTSGGLRSCGCKRKEALRIGSELKKHGMSKERIYRCFYSMHERCSAKGGSHKKNYADRGICVCKEWGDFNAFYEWATCNGYRDDLTLDRINNDGNYEPNNCRWITPKVQANNRRNTILIEYMGKTKTISEWAEEKGIQYKTIYDRYKRGDVGEKLFRPVQRLAV